MRPILRFAVLVLVTSGTLGDVAAAASGKDTVSIIDIADPPRPRIVADLPLLGFFIGPPTNVAVTPDECLALVASSVLWLPESEGWKVEPENRLHLVDIEASPPRVVDRVTVGDAPEGLAFSPRRDPDVAVLLNGSGAVPDDAWFAYPTSKLSLLALDAVSVREVGEVEVGGFAEGIAFSPDGGHLYIGNYNDPDLWALRVEGVAVSDTGVRIRLPGRPAALCSSAPSLGRTVDGITQQRQVTDRIRCAGSPMERRRGLLLGVFWRVVVMLVLFNPVLSLSHWLLVSWQDRPGLALIVLAIVALVLLYMLSLAREFPGVTLATGIGLGVILAGAALQGWVDLTSLRFWQWAAPVLAGILFAAGPAFAIIRRREAGISAADETPG